MLSRAICVTCQGESAYLCFQRTLRGEISLARTVDPITADLIGRLCQYQPHERCGSLCLDELRSHPAMRVWQRWTTNPHTAELSNLGRAFSEWSISRQHSVLAGQVRSSPQSSTSWALYSLLWQLRRAKQPIWPHLPPLAYTPLQGSAAGCVDGEGKNMTAGSNGAGKSAENPIPTAVSTAIAWTGIMASFWGISVADADGSIVGLHTARRDDTPAHAREGQQTVQTSTTPTGRLHIRHGGGSRTVHPYCRGWYGFVEKVTIASSDGGDGGDAGSKEDAPIGVYASSTTALEQPSASLSWYVYALCFISDGV